MNEMCVFLTIGPWSTSMTQVFAHLCFQYLYCSTIWFADLYFILFCDSSITKGWEPLTLMSYKWKKLFFSKETLISQKWYSYHGLLRNSKSISKTWFYILNRILFSIVYVICEKRNKEKELKTNMMWNAKKMFRK